jgi:hypothetical protein
VSSITNAASGQPVGLLGQYPPQRLIVPGRAGDEVLQLVVPRQAQAGRHRLQALALARAKQPAQVQRRPSPPLLVPERSKERLQPHIQIPHGPTHARFSKIQAFQPSSAAKQIRPKCAHVVLERFPIWVNRQGIPGLGEL